MKHWKTLYKSQKSEVRSKKFNIEEIIRILIDNRGVRIKKEVEEFLNPKLELISIDSVGIDKKKLKRAISRIKKAINNSETIVIYGDYDVDGICGTAILWETLYRVYKNVAPYIPDRFEEGYGLSVKGIQNLLAHKVQPSSRLNLEKVGLIITVDNGIVSHEAVEYAKSRGIDVIITDHHTIDKKVPAAYSIVHTTKLCGTGVSYMLSQEIKKILNSQFSILNSQNNYLDLVGLATIADLVPLTGANRVLAKFGIEGLRNTKRPGLLALFQVAGISKDKIGVYEVGHMIAPRLNAMGRLFSAMDSLRLICTKDRNKAQMLASALNQTNRERQLLTEQTTTHAKTTMLLSDTSKIIFAHHESYNEGIIGLVASKLVEAYYRPAFVVSVGQKISKGSARSINGVNIIEMIRSVSTHLVQAGGHPMAAGFTVESTKIQDLIVALEEKAQEVIDDELLKRTVRIDMELDFEVINHELYEKIQKLAPFGIGNPEPTFMSRSVEIEDIKLVGGDGRHLKLRLSQKTSHLSTLTSQLFEAIAFGMGERIGEFKVGDTVDALYTIAEDKWNGNTKLQLKIKDMRRIEALTS